MLYAFLAYHDESVITALSPEEDAALMVELHKVHDQLAADGRLGPAARLGPTGQATTWRREGGKAMVIDGPFAETKEQLLGLYIIDCESLEAAMQTAAALGKANPSAVYEVRPIPLFLPGVLPDGAA